MVAESARLADVRLDAIEECIDAELACGNHHALTLELARLVADHPLRERLGAQRVLALYRCGRQTEALRACNDIRRRLMEEVGVELGPALRHLERAVLEQRPELDWTAPPTTRRSVLGPDEQPLVRCATAAAGHPTPPVSRRTPSLPVSSFVGRDDDAARLIALLDACRIVTVCGPGGVGKSRLARHVARAVADRYDDGVIWVELGSLRDPSDVAGALAAELRLSAAADVALSARIVEVLAVRHQLIVLDNCEHLADAVAVLVESIGDWADRVDLLLTSREPLRVDGEHVLTLAPLDESAAVALLVDRIQSSAPDWISEAEDADLVADIVQRVDRLPLALELAAARVPVMGLRGLRDALEQPFEVLSRGRRTAAERHRSLRDVVEWSYRLLTPRQRDLFARLAVFAGQVEWDAIVQVCRDGDDDPEFSTLADLVDRSLVTVHVGNPTTYGMLETLRAFGRASIAGAAMDALSEQHSRLGARARRRDVCGGSDAAPGQCAASLRRPSRRHPARPRVPELPRAG